MLAAGPSAAAAARPASGQQQPQALQRRAVAGRRLSAPAAGGAADRGDGSNAEGDKWNERPTRNARRRLSMGAGPLNHGPLNPAPHVRRNEYGDASGDPYGCVIFWMLFSAVQKEKQCQWGCHGDWKSLRMGIEHGVPTIDQTLPD